MMKRAISILILLVVLCGCTRSGEEEFARPASVVQTESGIQGVGLWTKSQGLTKEQRILVTDFMDLFYGSLGALKPASFADLFAPEARDRAAFADLLLRYQIVSRQQTKGLTLAGYRYELRCEGVKKENGALQVLVLEYSAQRFTAWPEVEAERFDAWHAFTMKKTEGKWLLTDYDDSFAYVLGECYTLPESKAELEALFYDMEQDIRRLTDEKFQRGESTAPDAAAHPYDREAAVAYAEEYYVKRNGDWPDFTDYGGNCQNFASQCLIAGGIPMDTQGPAVWKYYGDGVNNLPTASGRSMSWAGARSFYDYARANRGFGLSAAADAPFLAGATGDLILMSPGDTVRHTVIIVDLLTDEQGRTVDYLVNSNTANLRHFPAGAYPYPHQVLVHINGWNDE